MSKNPVIAIENLAIELTRKCNLRCGHCMRGESEAKEISDQTLDRIFENISIVGLLNFIGGESSLAVDRINQLVDTLKRHKTIVHSILVFTNAIDISDEYINVLKNLRDIAIDDYNDSVGFTKRNEKEGKYPLKIVVSLDKFHLDSSDKLGVQRSKIKSNIERLAQIFPVEIDKLCNYVVYNEGRSTQLSSTYKAPSPSQKYCYTYRSYDNLLLIGPLLAIQYDGKIVEANRSYSYNDKNGIGNINTESLFSMLKKLKQEKGMKKCSDTESAYRIMDKYIHIFSSTTNELQNMLRCYKRKKQNMDYSYFEQTIPSISELADE